MKDAQKPDHMSFNTLVNRLKEGRFVIPDFQRDFEWRPWDIRDLIRSIFLDYYIGSLLLWKGKKENFEALSCEVIYGYNNTPGEHPWNYGNGKPEYIVLDGQQRLTALYYAFIAPKVSLPNRASRAIYFVHVDKFMNEQYDIAFQYDWLSKRYTKILNDPELQFREHFFPLSIIGQDGWNLYKWVTNYAEYWKEEVKKAENNGDTDNAKIIRQHAINAKAFGEHLKGITEQYQIVYIELDKDLPVDKVCDIFTQINSRGIRLDVFDLINALLKPKDIQLKHMYREAAPKLEFVETEKMNVYVLQVMSILCQAYCSPKYLYYLLPEQEKQVREPNGTMHKEILVKDTKDFVKKWETAVNSLEYAIKMLQHPQEYGVTSSQYLPYVSILPVFAALQYVLNNIPYTYRLEAQKKFRLWYWASVFTNRYSGSVESTSARDYLEIKNWFEDKSAEPALFGEFKSTYQHIDLRRETNRGSSLYNGIFNLFVINGARDWVSGNIPKAGDVDDHHIVPSSWGRNHIKGNLIHSILNRTPLTADTNRHIINDRLPNEYLPELIKSSGKKQVYDMLGSHFISEKALDILLRNPFGPEDFENFITERQKTIKDGIDDLIIKQRINLEPLVRELDQKIENIELAFRKLIVKTCKNDIKSIPHYVRQKADERILNATKKDPAFNIEKYKTFVGLLEYFDLRELQNAISSKVLWNLFQPVFLNKEKFTQKFNQLAELRNSIRHSRSIDNIVRKEGEAAISWFTSVLKLYAEETVE